MQIDLDNMNPGTFFPFDEEDEEKKKEGVLLRVLTAGILEEITNKCRIKKIEVRGNPAARFEVLEFKKGGEEKEFELTWDYCIMEWSGVIDKLEKEIPCTPENKVALMKDSIQFSTFINEAIRKINVQHKAHEEDLETNLGST
jgi:hypothetical protein